MTVLVSLLLLGWAALLPAGQPPQWWHYAIGVALILAFLGSWHGQHVSTTLRRWAPVSLYNRRQRTRRVQPGRRRATEDAGSGPASPEPRSNALEARIVIHLRPHPHAMTTPGDTTDQMPWQFVTSWLHRYGVRADVLTIAAVTRTPPASGLRTDSAALLTGLTPQHRDTWLTYTLRAESNVAALTARQTTMGSSGEDADSAGPQRAALADTVARRLIAELRERGWLATLSDDDGQKLPEFVPAAAAVRREHWTGTEHTDGFRAVYAVDPGRLVEVLRTLPTVATRATWVVLTVRTPALQPASIEACVGMITSAKPARKPLPGLEGFHGLHRKAAPALSVTGFEHEDFDLPTSGVDWDALTQLSWPTAAAGVPIGFNRRREPVYLGLASPEPVRITVTGTGQFHLGVVSRLALSGLPVAVYTADARSWTSLANHAAPQQFSMRPPTPAPGSIVVTDGSMEVPGSPITVTLRRPQSAQAPSTTVVITQDGARADLFHVVTAHGRQMLSTRLTEPPGQR